ncbi:MAG: hypothetical protein FJ403_02305 [Verrucomicrobia bacterium]|nr:hypothetical protein [Verrucomicrobiota bacterium]
MINREPVLVAEGGERRRLTVFALPGTNYAIERSSDVASGWQLVVRRTRSALADRIEIGGSDSPSFYRATR